MGLPAGISRRSGASSEGAWTGRRAKKRPGPRQRFREALVSLRTFRNARRRGALYSLRFFRNAPVAGRCTRSRFLRNARRRGMLERGLFPAWPPFSRRRHRNSVPSFLQKEQNPHPNPNSLIQQDIPFSCKETGKIFADSGRASPSLPRPFSCYASHFYFLIFFVLICFLPILYSRNAFQRSARKRAWSPPFFFLSASSVGGEASRFPIPRLSPIGFLGRVREGVLWPPKNLLPPYPVALSRRPIPSLLLCG